jgi:hypothetical protein
MEAICSSKTSVDFQRITRRYIPLFAIWFRSGFLLDLFFDPEDGGDMFLRNVGWLSTDYMALYTRRQCSPNKKFIILVKFILRKPQTKSEISAYFFFIYPRSHCFNRSTFKTTREKNGGFVLCGLFNDALVSRLGLCSVRWQDGWWIGQDLEGSGRGLIEVISRNLAWRTEEIIKNLRTASVPGEIRTEELLNTTPEPYF